MLTIIIPEMESYDETANEFTTSPAVTVELEHSLASVSKWEALHEKPFLGKDTKSTEEVFSYIECMTLDPNLPPELFTRINSQHVDQITKYINSKQTATWFSEDRRPGGPAKTITAELIYSWMVHYGIDFQCQYWHLNRLLTLIRVCGVNQEEPKKVGRAEAAEKQRQLNAQRRAQLNTSG